jgi:hypothetical protein
LGKVITRRNEQAVCLEVNTPAVDSVLSCLINQRQDESTEPLAQRERVPLIMNNHGKTHSLADNVSSGYWMAISKEDFG